MPLTMVNCDQDYKVTHINGPHVTRMKLTNLGITCGSTIRIVNRSLSTIIVAIRNSRIMIECGMANQIQVQ
jgi:ferrous iron transport protein A